MVQSIEGVYKQGDIELFELPKNVSESRVIVTFLEPQQAQQPKRMIRFGMFSGEKQSTEEDFKITELYRDGEDIDEKAILSSPDS